MRLARNLCGICVVTCIVAVVLWNRLRCAACLVRGLKYKISRCCARVVGHWLANTWAIALQLQATERLGAKAGSDALGGRKQCVADEALSKVLDDLGTGTLPNTSGRCYRTVGPLYGEYGETGLWGAPNPLSDVAHIWGLHLESFLD